VRSRSAGYRVSTPLGKSLACRRIFKRQAATRFCSFFVMALSWVRKGSQNVTLVRGLPSYQCARNGSSVKWWPGRELNTLNLSWSHLRHSWLVDRDAPRPRNARQIPMAPWPRPCRPPRRKSVFRAYAPLLGQYVRHAASHDRHRRQSSPASWAIFVEWSWSAL
jgi:hypothetical protein